MEPDWARLAGLKVGIDDKPMPLGDRLEFVMVHNDENPAGWALIMRGMHNSIWSRYIPAERR